MRSSWDVESETSASPVRCDADAAAARIPAANTPCCPGDRSRRRPPGGLSHGPQRRQRPTIRAGDRVRWHDSQIPSSTEAMLLRAPRVPVHTGAYGEPPAIAERISLTVHWTALWSRSITVRTLARRYSSLVRSCDPIRDLHAVNRTPAVFFAVMPTHDCGSYWRTHPGLRPDPAPLRRCGRDGGDLLTARRVGPAGRTCAARRPPPSSHHAKERQKRSQSRSVISLTALREITSSPVVSRNVFEDLPSDHRPGYPSHWPAPSHRSFETPDMIEHAALIYRNGRTSPWMDTGYGVGGRLEYGTRCSPGLPPDVP